LLAEAEKDELLQQAEKDRIESVPQPTTRKLEILPIFFILDKYFD